MISVLFVCVANICRSPALMASLKHLAAERGLSDKLYVDSCGIAWSHLGEHPDKRTFDAAKKRGVLIDHRSQQFQESFFDAYDFIFAATGDVAEQLKLRASNPKHLDKIRLATDFSSKYKGQDIPDPYYLSPTGFDDVMEIILDSVEGILNSLFRK